MSGQDALFAATWVHAFEEDGPDGAVYRPESFDLPLSRRPRQRLSFARDGSARLTVAGPDDRLRDVEARWREEGGEIAVSAAGEGRLTAELRVRVRSDDCLVVRR